MRPLRRLIWIAVASTCVLAAQDDPPSRVARISYTYGSVSFRPGDADDWFAADFNRPLTTGDHVYANPGATVQLEIGTATLLLGSNSLVDILNLDDSNVQLRMTQGLMIVRVRTLGEQETFEVDTPNLAFSVQQTGGYRIEVPPNSTTTLTTVRAGAAQLNGSDQAFSVQPGEQVEVDGMDQPNYQRYAAPPYDTLENFLAQQEQRDEQSPSARYCSREMIGYQDLDRYGSWRSTPDYGMAWVPNNMPSGWAPYHTGHWLWVDPWGWTWVDDAPWGFAPFHYGRWAYVGYWAWVPGPVSQRPVYAPALVAWAGGDAAGGGVGWFPLGPREVYVPAYHASPTYVNRVNVTNTVIVNNINITNVNVTNVNYVNRAAPGAVMAVQRDAFLSAKPVQTASIAVRPEAARSATVVAALNVAPTRASVVRAPTAGANVAKPPAALETRPVIVKKAPPPPPVPFAQKQAALAANGGRPLDRNQVQQLRQAQPAPAAAPVRQVQHAVSTGPPTTQAPVRHAAPPGSQTPQRAPAPAAAAPPSQSPRPAPQTREPAVREEHPAPAAQPAAQPPKEEAPAAQRPPAPTQPVPSPAARPSSTAPPPAKVAPKDDKRDKDKKDEKKDQKKDEKKDDKQG